MRSKRFGTLLFVVAIGFALIASFTAIHVVQAYQKVGQVIKAKTNIEPYSKITDKDVERTTVPLAAITPSSVTNASKVVGKFSKSFIPSGAIVDTNEIATVDGANGGVSVPLSDMNKQDMRAIGIAEEYVHILGDQLKDQDHVDLVGLFTRDKESFAKTIAQGVTVLKRNPQDKGGGAIVAVTAKQAEEISLAISFGKLVVSLTPYKYQNQPLQGTYLESLYIGGAPQPQGGTGK
jgi:Flp pilus assembly protein CpaB